MKWPVSVLSNSTNSRMGKSLTLDNLTWTTVQHILTLFFSLGAHCRSPEGQRRRKWASWTEEYLSFGPQWVRTWQLLLTLSRPRCVFGHCIYYLGQKSFHLLVFKVECIYNSVSNIQPKFIITLSFFLNYFSKCQDLKTNVSICFDPKCNCTQS